MYPLVKQFHEKFRLNYDGPARALPIELFDFRAGFMQEELDEYKEAHARGDLATCLDSLCDLDYVLKGTAYLHGFRRYDEAFIAVHMANMEKKLVEKASDSKRGSRFDVVKPPGWQHPDISQFLV